jgi:outer membrane receptor protein involved in Fe transport
MSGVVVGDVRAALDSQPIMGAHVLVSGLPGEVRTDARGRFRVRLESGTYDLTVRALGYAPRELPDLAVTGGDTSIVSVYLRRAPLRLTEIIVTPSTFGILDEDEVVTQQTLSRDEVRSQPGLGEDIYRAVDRLPGVSSHDITAKLHVRGGPNDQLLHMLDGVELYEAFHLKDAGGVFSIIDVESVSGVDLLTGGFTAEYGDKMTGVFSMRTTTPPPDRIRTTLGLSLGNVSAKSEGGFAGGKGTWLASVRRGYLDIIFELTGVDEEINPTYYDAYAKVQYQLSPRHLFTGHVLHAGDRMSSHEDDGTMLESDWGSSYVWLNWHADFTNSLSVQTMLSYANGKRERLGAENDLETGVPQLDVDDIGNFDSYGVRQTWSLLASDWLALKWGADLRQSTADYDYFRWRRSWVPNTTHPFAPSWSEQFDTVTVAVDTAGFEAGLYLSSRFRPLEQLTTEVGVRYDRHSHTDEEDWSPRINVALEFAPRTTLRGAWGLFYQSHELHGMYVIDGDDQFYPAQHAEHRVLGLSHRLLDGTSIRLEAYERRIFAPSPEYRSLEGQIEVVPEEGPGDRIRVDPTRGLARGIELFVKRDVGGRFAWSASYALAEAKEEIDGGWVYRPFDQRHTLNIEAAYRPNRWWSLSCAFHFHSGWPATEEIFYAGQTARGDYYSMSKFGELYAERMPAYHRMDVRISRRFPIGRSQLSIFLDVFNIYDRENTLALNTNVNWHWTGNRARIVTTRGAHGLIGILPTVGARWEF